MAAGAKTPPDRDPTGQWPSRAILAAEIPSWFRCL